MANLDSILKSRDIFLPTKICLVKATVMYGYENWTVKKAEWQKNWYFWTVVLVKTLEIPWDCKEIQPVNLKGNQLWIFIWKTDAEAESLILWPPDAKKLIHWKRPCCWEKLKAGGEGEDRGWNSCMASPTWWTWVSAISCNWLWTAKPVVMHSWGHK